MRPVTLLAVLAAVLGLAACGEKSEPDVAKLPPPPSTTATAPTTTTTRTTTTTTATKPDGGTVRETVRRYYAGLNLGRGGVVCNLLAAGAIDELELPRHGGDCASALSRSIGYHEPNGPPAFRSAHPRRRRTQERDGRAKVVATVVTRYEDERRPSIDDDIIYLRKTPEGWVILKPSAILYRAVGIEPPLAALRPPPGF